MVDETVEDDFIGEQWLAEIEADTQSDSLQFFTNEFTSYWDQVYLCTEPQIVPGAPT